MSQITFVGAVTEYRASSLGRVQRGASRAAYTGTGGGA
jgi:hypothetical protein